MTNETRISTIAGLPANIDLSASDVPAILQLLGSAGESIRNHGDGFCAGLLGQCAAHLRERYGLEAGRADGLPWRDSSLPALVHLLIYVRAEVKEKLRDPACVAALDRCVDRLLQMHVVLPEQGCGRAVTSH
jgi:hypothetical protein